MIPVNVDELHEISAHLGELAECLEEAEYSLQTASTLRKEIYEKLVKLHCRYDEINKTYKQQFKKELKRRLSEKKKKGKK